MAKIQCELKGNFEGILCALENAVMDGSASASREEGSDFWTPHSKCAVRVYERYSMLGGNRVSLSITLYQAEGRIWLSAITAGGSQAAVFKVNTFGEEAFLDTIRDTVEQYLA